jgi:hypothetical protein
MSEAQVLVEFRNAFPKLAKLRGWGGITASTDLRARNLEGITVDESGAVTTIDLHDKGLEGKHIPGRHQCCPV